MAAPGACAVTGRVSVGVRPARLFDWWSVFGGGAGVARFFVWVGLWVVGVPDGGLACGVPGGVVAGGLVAELGCEDVAMRCLAVAVSRPLVWRSLGCSWVVMWCWWMV